MQRLPTQRLAGCLSLTLSHRQWQSPQQLLQRGWHTTCRVLR
jgi:hypothetical protein